VFDLRIWNYHVPFFLLNGAVDTLITWTPAAVAKSSSLYSSHRNKHCLPLEQTLGSQCSNSTTAATSPVVALA
jgi:hypothetical protein